MIYIEGSSSLGKILTILLLQQAIENLSFSLRHWVTEPQLLLILRTDPYWNIAVEKDNITENWQWEVKLRAMRTKAQWFILKNQLSSTLSAYSSKEAEGWQAHYIKSCRWRYYQVDIKNSMWISGHGFIPVINCWKMTHIPVSYSIMWVLRKENSRRSDKMN